MRPFLLISLPLLTSLMLSSPIADAAQTTINGPAGSVAFGERVAVLPNGNIVVVDSKGMVSGNGAVYLYSPRGDLISELTGSSTNDHVGAGGIVVLSNGNFLVLSPDWNNGSALKAGAATWVNGATGLNGVVSSSNSLVGTTQADAVGAGARALPNGNYVVTSYAWSTSSATAVGAVTWGNVLGGVAGAVSAGNSLVGSTANDHVGGGGITALTNGNYVVVSPDFANGASSSAGAATWADGSTGIVGNITVGNSLLGTTTGDSVGYPRVTPLTNGNYVVAASQWNNGVANSHVGAAIWGDGTSGTKGLVSASNALYGSTPGDNVATTIFRLTNGNYVVESHQWSASSSSAQVGAVTWGNGTSGIVGAVSSANSLVGSTANDLVGLNEVYPLSNGNYVVASSACAINGISQAGAATWGNGSSGTVGPVSTSNSLYGAAQNDRVGAGGVTALTNGNYVVDSIFFSRGIANGSFGAVTWGNGTAGVTGPVGTLNSFVGLSQGDELGFSGVVALTNGNYVVSTSFWKNQGAAVGAVALLSGSGMSTGVMTWSNSLTGSVTNDFQFMSIVPLSNGNFVAAFPNWSNGTSGNNYGAVSWQSGSAGINQGSVVTPQNALVGSFAGTHLGEIETINGVLAYPGSVYAIRTSPQDSHPGSVTLADGRFGAVGTAQPYNTVYGNPDDSPTPLWDPVRQHLVVGFPDNNSVVLLSFEQIFAGRFD